MGFPPKICVRQESIRFFLNICGYKYGLVNYLTQYCAFEGPLIFLKFHLFSRKRQSNVQCIPGGQPMASDNISKHYPLHLGPTV